MNKKKLNLILLFLGVLIGGIAFILYFFLFYKEAESQATRSNTEWSYLIKKGTKESGIIPVGDTKLFVHLKNPREHEYYFKVLDKTTGKEVWAIDNIKEKLLVDKEHFQWKYYPRDSFLYFRDWISPYKEDKFALTKINLHTGEIVWTNPPIALLADEYYYDMAKLSFHITKGYICMLDDKNEQYYLFDDKNGMFVTAAQNKNDWHKNFKTITKEELKDYNINNFIVTGRYLYNFHKMVMFSYPQEDFRLKQVLLTNNQLIEIRLQEVEEKPVIWIQGFDWNSNKSKANLTLARKYKADYKILQKNNFLAIKEDAYKVTRLWKIDEEKWNEVLAEKQKAIKKWGMSDYEFYYETEHPENHDRIIHAYDFESQQSYLPIVRYLKEEYKTWDYTIDNRVCYQVAWDKKKQKKELHAITIW